MAKNDDFTSMYDTIAQSTADVKKRGPRRTYNAQEAREIAETMKTSGRKGAKMPRVNFAFRPSIYEYVTVMARVSGMNMTEFINKVLEDHMQEHMDLYNKALEFRDKL